MLELNIKTLNREYINVDQEDIYLLYPNCVAAIPKRFNTNHYIMYPEYFEDETKSGIIKGLYLTVQNNTNNIIFVITGGVIKLYNKLAYVKPQTFSVLKNNIRQTFSNNNTIYLNIKGVDNNITDPSTQNYEDFYFVLSDNIVSPTNENILNQTLYVLNKDANNNLYVDYDASVVYRL